MVDFARLLGLAQKALDKAGAASGEARPPATRPAPPERAPYGEPAGASGASAPSARSAASAASDAADRAAIARYDYLLQTADPHQIEQVHREAFERLTPAQRAQIDERMRAELPAHEHPRSSRSDDLARAATRTEMGRPGVVRGLLARAGGGRGATGSHSRAGGAGAMGGAVAAAGLAAGGMLAAVAGGAVVSSVAGPLLEQATSLGVDFDALAGAVDLEGLTGGLDGLAGGVEGLTGGVEGLSGGVDELAAGAGETVSGLGDQVSGLGDQVRELASGFEIPGLGDLFRR
ncbi:hypothetical protein ACEXOS_002670 [Herbiconiux sp. P16]|uniref:hypothetical protein n=1 Tax=Herbiconiux wuyangfengii TaxID=3342794 RepID=UPI0035BB2066